MAIDIKAQAESIIKKAMADKAFRDSFLKDPVKAVESVTGVDLPDAEINKIIGAVKEKLNLGSMPDLGAIGSLFGKK